MNRRNLRNPRPIIICLFLLILLCFTSAAHATKIRAFTALTGGGTGAMDKINDASLSNGDSAIVITSSACYFYTYNSSSTATESPPSVIVPDSAPSTGRWILSSCYFGNINGVSHDNPFIRLDETDGTDWWIGADDTSGTLQFRNAHALDSQVRLELIEAEGLDTNETTALYLVTRDGSGNIKLQQITLGTTDSGGTGYRVLRVPNTN